MTSITPTLGLSETPSRSCDRCRKKKLRCDRKYPCGSCKNPTLCHYSAAKPRLTKPTQAHLNKYLKVLHMVSTTNPLFTNPAPIPPPQPKPQPPSQLQPSTSSLVRSKPQNIIVSSKSHPQSQSLVRVRSRTKPVESPLLTPGFDFMKFKTIGISNLKFIQIYRSIGASSPVKFSLALSGIKLSQLEKIQLETLSSSLNISIGRDPSLLIQAIVTNDTAYHFKDFFQYQMYKLHYEHCIHAFFDKFHVLFPVVSKLEFMDSSDNNSPQFVLRRLVIWVIGNYYLLDYDPTIGKAINIEINKLAPTASKFRSAETIQSYALISYTWMSFNEQYNHWHYIGLAHRMAMMMGYHLKPPRTLPIVEYIERECLWMFIMYMENRSMVQMGKMVSSMEWVSSVYKYRHMIQFSEDPSGDELEILFRLCAYYQLLFRLNVASYYLAPSVYYTLNPDKLTPSLKTSMLREFQIMFRNSRYQINQFTSKIPKDHPLRQLHVLYSLVAFHLFSVGLLFMNNAFFAPVGRFHVDQLNQLINISNLLFNVWLQIEDSFMPSERMYTYHLLAMFYFRLLNHTREEANTQIKTEPIIANLKTIHQVTLKICRRIPNLEEYLIFFYKYSEIYNIQLN